MQPSVPHPLCCAPLLIPTKPLSLAASLPPPSPKALEQRSSELAQRERELRDAATTSSRKHSELEAMHQEAVKKLQQDLTQHQSAVARLQQQVAAREQKVRARG